MQERGQARKEILDVAADLVVPGVAEPGNGGTAGTALGKVVEQPGNGPAADQQRPQTHAHEIRPVHDQHVAEVADNEIGNVEIGPPQIEVFEDADGRPRLVFAAIVDDPDGGKDRYHSARCPLMP